MSARPFRSSSTSVLLTLRLAGRSWHRDGSTPDAYEKPSPAHDIKVFIYFDDVDEDGGCTVRHPSPAPLCRAGAEAWFFAQSVIPASHKLPDGPTTVFGSMFRTAYPTKHSGHPESEPIKCEELVNCVRFACKAGTACAFVRQPRLPSPRL